MKVIINNINIYHIHDNRFNSYGGDNHFNVGLGKAKDTDLDDFSSCIIVNDDLVNDDYPFIEQLKDRILQSEIEFKELLDKLNNETKYPLWKSEMYAFRLRNAGNLMKLLPHLSASTK